MAIPLSYNFRNLVVRKTTTIMTAAGIAMTVAVLLAVLGLVSGLQSAFASTGDPLHVLVMRKGGNAELTSLLTQQQFQIVKNFPGIATGHDGQPLASLEDSLGHQSSECRQSQRNEYHGTRIVDSRH